MGTGGGVRQGSCREARRRAVLSRRIPTRDLDRRAWKPNLVPQLAGRVPETPRHGCVLLLLAPTTTSIGYSGRGDFSMRPDGRLTRRGERDVVPFVFAGAAVLAPRLLERAPAGAFPLTLPFDRAAEAGRLFGLRLEGVWMHVGTPDAVAAAEAAIVESVGVSGGAGWYDRAPQHCVVSRAGFEEG